MASFSGNILWVKADRITLFSQEKTVGKLPGPQGSFHGKWQLTGDMVILL